MLASDGVHVDDLTNTIRVPRESDHNAGFDFNFERAETGLDRFINSRRCNLRAVAAVQRYRNPLGVTASQILLGISPVHFGIVLAQVIDGGACHNTRKTRTPLSSCWAGSQSRSAEQ